MRLVLKNKQSTFTCAVTFLYPHGLLVRDHMFVAGVTLVLDVTIAQPSAVHCISLTFQL